MASEAKKYDVFQAIADPTRRKVLQLLSEQELPISKIASYFPMSRTAIVKHLHILSEANLVSGHKNGREKLYRLHPETFIELTDWLALFEKFWDNKLALLKYRVENDDENALQTSRKFEE